MLSTSRSSIFPTRCFAIYRSSPEVMEGMVPETRAWPECVSPCSRDRQTSPSDAERCAGGAPNVPERGGVLEGGACPPLHFIRSAPPTLLRRDPAPAARECGRAPP